MTEETPKYPLTIETQHLRLLLAGRIRLLLALTTASFAMNALTVVWMVWK